MQAYLVDIADCSFSVRGDVILTIITITITTTTTIIIIIIIIIKVIHNKVTHPLWT